MQTAFNNGWTSWIPFWGTGKNAYYEYQQGNYLTAGIYAVFAGLDAGMITGLARRACMGVAGRIGLGRMAAASDLRLFSYSVRPSFEGNVFKVGHAGRAWATQRAPGSWAFEGGLWNTLVRMWHTGHVKPFASFIEITGPAKDLFVRVGGIGPARGWKWAGGQYFTLKPGDVNLSTGVIAKATAWQWAKFSGDIATYYTVDGMFLAVIYYNVHTRLFLLSERDK